MTRVVFTDSGSELGLYVVGHSGYAVAGQDIVCAGASVLVDTLAEYVFREDFDTEPIVRLGDGEAVIKCTVTADNAERVRLAFDFAKIGYQMLAQEYPNNVLVVDGTDR